MSHQAHEMLVLIPAGVIVAAMWASLIWIAHRDGSQEEGAH